MCLTVAGVAGLAGIRAHAAPTVDEFIDPFTLDGINPCTNEPLFISGETRTRIRIDVDRKGERHVSFTLVMSHLRGIGEDGTQYVMVGGEHDHLNVFDNDPLPTDETFSSAVNLIGLGKGSNFTTHFTSHVTITADGITRSEVLLDRAECHG